MPESHENLPRATPSPNDGGGLGRLLELPPVVMLLIGLAGGGGIGTFATGGDVAEELRGVRTELVQLSGVVHRVGDRVDDNARRVDRLEGDLNSHLNAPAHGAALARLDALEAAVRRLESR